MADLVETSDWQQRYEGIENAYCQGRWAAVMENGTVLLRELLDAGEDPEVEALRHRMQLLMAHTLLHGYGDRDAAEDLYEVVHRSDAEPTLRQMAEDGLDLCHQPLPSTLAIEEDGEDPSEEAPSVPVLFLPDTEKGDEEDKAWPEPSRTRSPASQMPLQPRPTVSPEIEPEEAGSAPDPLPEPVGALGMATDPFGTGGVTAEPGPDQGLPVMPWLLEPSAGPSQGLGEPEGRVVGELPWVEQTIGETMRADVVEEPELIELHQSTPSLAEEVDLPIREELAPAPPSAVDGAPEDDGDLRTGLLLVVLG
jgi:hypothetical protein